MRIAAMGDIHGNHIALEACMKWVYRNNIDGIAFLGDYISDCPYPEKTMRIIRNIPDAFRTWFVRGNREDYMLDHRYNLTEEWRRGSSRSGSLLYTYQALSGGDMRFLEAMPIGMEVKLDGYPPFSICHGSMQDNRRLIFPDSPDIDELFDEFMTGVLVCGHCHKPYTATRGSKTIINAGSVGNPVYGQKGASIVLLTSDGGEWSAKHIEIPYDKEALIEEFEQSGLLYFADVWARAFIASLRDEDGRNFNYECATLVKELCAEQDKEFDDEDIWQEAAKRLGI